MVRLNTSAVVVVQPFLSEFLAATTSYRLAPGKERTPRHPPVNVQIEYLLEGN